MLNNIDKCIKILWIYLERRGILIKKKYLERIAAPEMIDFISDGLAFHEGNPKDFSIKYHEFFISNSCFFNFLSQKSNARIAYKKIKRVKGNQDYKKEVDSHLSTLANNLAFNEQIHIKSNSMAKYHLVDSLSLIIEYTDGTMGIVRIEFKNKKTAYMDQGKIISMVTAHVYLLFFHEHNILTQVNLDDMYLLPDKRNFFDLTIDRVKEIKHMIFFREPGEGNVLGKREYRYSANYFYIESLHRKPSIDLSQASMIDDENRDRDQFLAYELYKDTHGKYNENIIYFNFIDAYIKIENFDSYIHSDIYEEVVNFINWYYFETVTDQQILMYNMIKNKIQSVYTESIQSCCYSSLEFAKSELKKVDDNTIEEKAIKQFIDKVKDKNGKRINPGSGYFYDMIIDDSPENKYIVENFASSIPWMNWEDNMYFAEEYLSEVIGEKQYEDNKENLEFLLGKIFGEKGILYGDKKYSRGVFYEEVIEQFNIFGDYEKEEREKGRIISIDDVLKPSIRVKAEKLLYGE